MKIFFCEGCGKRLTDGDLEIGAAVDKQLSGIFCLKCAGVTPREFTPPKKPIQQPAAANHAPSGSLTAAPVSGRHVRPASQTRVTPAAPSPNKATSGHVVPRTRESPPAANPAIFIGAGVGVVVLIGIFGWAMHDTGTAKTAQTPRAKPATEGLERTPANPSPNVSPVARSDPRHPADRLATIEAPAKPAVPDPAASRETQAQKAFDEATAFRGLAADDKAGRIKVLEAFIRTHGDSILIARAKNMLEQFQRPAETKPVTGNPPTAKDPEMAKITDSNVAFQKGVEAGQKGEIELALRYYNRAVEIQPTAESLCNRAEVKRVLLDLEGSVSDAERSYGLNSALWQPYAQRAISLMGLGRDADAAPSLQKVRSMVNQPDGLETWIRQNGQALRLVYEGKQMEGKTPATAADFEKRARYRLHTKRWEEGCADLEEALKLDPPSGARGVFSLLALAQNQRKDSKAEIATAKRWVEAAPLAPEALNYYAWALLNTEDAALRDPKAALPLAQKAAELTNNGSSPIMDTLALAYFRNGKKREAVDAVNKAISLLPPNSSPALKKVYEDHLKEFESAQ